MTRTFDAVSLEIVWKRLISIIDQTAVTLKRTSFSPLVREGNDFSCLLLGADASSAVQSSLSAPSFLGTLPYTVEQMLVHVPRASLVPGDVLITNDPWIGTGHLLDISIVTPIFREGKLIAFVANAAHAPDIGGIGFSATGSDVVEEGLMIPVSRLYRAGVRNDDVFNFIRHNVRVPDVVHGDLEAQVAANHVTGKLINEFLTDSILDLDQVIAELQDRSEEAVRAAIRRVPDGVYRSQLVADGFESPITLCCQVRVHEDSITVDYAGSSQASPRGINSPFNYTQSYTMYGLKCVLDPQTPNNAGCARPVRITAPEGSILNARWPAPTLARHAVGNLLPSLVLSALAPVCADRVQADSGSAPIWITRFDGLAPGGRPFTLTQQFSGGQGARSTKNGLSAVSFPANASTTPIEVVESVAPLLITEKALIPGSGGSGRHLGGLGQRVVFQSTAGSDMRVSVLADRVENPASGVMGGSPGRRGAVLLDGRPLPSKCIATLRPGGTLVLEMPGGGGWGSLAAPDAAAAGEGGVNEPGDC